MTARSSVEKYQHFELTCCLHLRGRNESPPKRLLSYQFPLRRFPERHAVTASDLTKITVFWDVTSYSLVDWYQHFGGLVCLLLQGSKQILPKRSYISAKVYGITSLHTHRCKSLRISQFYDISAFPVSACVPTASPIALTKRCCYVTMAACLTLTYPEATVGHNLLFPHRRRYMTYAADKTSLNNPCDEEYCLQGCNTV
jgi:hypothetical protein